ncbi:hypothetical protein MRAB57_4079 [Mycobacterium rhizamassiliense]|jgi:hypothetical protein|uniref:Uncharacterized protein n=1 Tax=Mycobacterium rhizamassiliense TaxID=1841860 RepID=A0A2U3NXJ7_9MYCO|nr:hypothetical protein [Mycobacterium rhizamassiliense]SPM36239.1 hypothetical protein MRAB57_4079 [Mycobacterium rhizamassiliense]
MARRAYVVAAVAAAVGLVAAGCGNSSNSHTATSASTPASKASKTVTASVSQATTTTSASVNTDLQALIPVPPNTAHTDGPDSIQENGIHLHFMVNGAPVEVMAAYKTALLGKSWSLILDSSSNGGSGGGATYTASNGNAFGFFNGGGWGDTVDIDACAWPAKPADHSCGHQR